MPEVRTTSSTGGQKGVKLARFDLIPAGPLRELAEHYGRGARKYANHQWRQGYEWSKSIGALGRHFNDFMAGKDYDVCSNEPDNCSFVDSDGNEYIPDEPDTCYNHTGSHHMAAVAWHAFLLLEFKDTHPTHDDRYGYPTQTTLEKLLDKFEADHNYINVLPCQTMDPAAPIAPTISAPTSFLRPLDVSAADIPPHMRDRLFREMNT